MTEKKRTRWALHAGQKWLVPMLMASVAGCDGSGVMEPPVSESYAVLDGGRSGAELVFTGMVDLVWPGGKGAGAPDDDRIAQAEIAAFLGVPEGTPGPGNFTYRVISADGLTIHREIGVRLAWVALEDQTVLLDGQEGVQLENDIRFIGVVVSDTKPCGGSGHGSGGGCGEEGGGCSGEEGGCSHDDGSTGEEGGCSHDDGTTHDEGGCSGDDGTTHEGGGCSGDDGTTHDEGGCGGSGGEGGHGEPGGSGGNLSGNDCRIGQIVIGWMLDGTPEAIPDRVSWKWMAPDAPKVAAIQEDIAAIEAGEEGRLIRWPCKLCEKVILGGELRLREKRP